MTTTQTSSPIYPLPTWRRSTGHFIGDHAVIAFSTSGALTRREALAISHETGQLLYFYRALSGDWIQDSLGNIEP